MARKKIKVHLIDEYGNTSIVDMTYAEYYYRKWFEKHHILGTFFGIFTFESLYWLYFKIKYRK